MKAQPLRYPPCSASGAVRSEYGNKRPNGLAHDMDQYTSTRQNICSSRAVPRCPAHHKSSQHPQSVVILHDCKIRLFNVGHHMKLRIFLGGRQSIPGARQREEHALLLQSAPKRGRFDCCQPHHVQSTPCPLFFCTKVISMSRVGVRVRSRARSKSSPYCSRVFVCMLCFLMI